MEKDKEYTIETFAYIANLNTSILLLNNWLRLQGFEFIEVDLTTFQDKFGALVYYKEGLEPDHKVLIGNETLHGDFYTLFSNSPFFDTEILINKTGVILLRKVDSYKQLVINNSVKIQMESAAITQKFTEELIRKFRLFKTGNIHRLSLFEIHSDTRLVSMRMTGVKTQIRPAKNFYLEDSDVNTLLDLLESKINITKLNEIALLNFEESYHISNPKIRFITLITSLESLFNFGKDQIVHTISRHLSLIISDTKVDFETNYKQIKKLYGKRSAIVHGGGEKVSDDELLEVENLVRKALMFTLKHSYSTKEELFLYLNSKGY